MTNYFIVVDGVICESKFSYLGIDIDSHDGQDGMSGQNESNNKQLFLTRSITEDKWITAVNNYKNIIKKSHNDGYYIERVCSYNNTDFYAIIKDNSLYRITMINGIICDVTLTKI